MSVVVVLLSGIVWRGASAHFKGHVEAKCMLWAKQAGYKAWRAKAALSVSETVGKSGFQGSNQ